MLPHDTADASTPPPPLISSSSSSSSTSTPKPPAALQKQTHDLVHNCLCAGDASTLKLPYPTSFNPDDKSNNVTLSHQNLRIAYCGPRESDKNAASARANCHIPCEGIACFYYEITVVDAGMNGYIGIGMTGANVDLERLPGWEKDSYGYHGDDGNVFESRGEPGKRYGPKFTTGDTVGMCWDMEREVVFFTKNGTPLSVAFENVKRTFLMYPAVGLQSKGETVEINFGASRFKYDIEQYVLARRFKLLQGVYEGGIENYYQTVSKIILDYLVHHGYSSTAELFARHTSFEKDLEMEMDSIQQRQGLIRNIKRGEIDVGLDKVGELYPELLKDPSRIAFLLKSQKFLEMIRSKETLTDTLMYGQQTLGVYRDQKGMDVVLPDSLEDILSLVAYPDPSEHPQAHLLGEERREMVAEELNSAILKSQARPSRSVLECLIAQARTVLCEHRRTCNGALSFLTFDDFV